LKISRIFPYLYSFILLMLGLCIAPSQATPSKPTIDWQPCPQETGQPFECATVNVPLIHNISPDKESPMVSIAMVRLPATDPERRIGSLFFNPGGPGGSGVDLVVANGPALYTDEVRARFDLVGFDPRGIARSDALVCFESSEELNRVQESLTIYPISLEEINTRRVSDKYFAEHCEKRASAIIDYMTTADVARDLDLLRQAVGDEQMNFVGYSYGSYLGVTYANLFPSKVGAIVLDGVVDPIAWATGRHGERFTTPTFTRLRSDAGALVTLNEFFRLCDEGSGCAFAGDSAARFAALAESIKAKPLVIALPDFGTIEMGYNRFISSTLSILYNSSTWPTFAQILAAAEAQASPEVIGALVSELLGEQELEGEEESSHGQTIEGLPGVVCGDSDNPSEFWAWPIAAEIAEASNGYFGPDWAWSSSVCAQWPGSMDSRYIGPFDKHTANPVLVTNTLFDPATRHESAVTVANLLPNSRLLTVEGWGHGTVFLSQCATQTVSDYLVNGTLPPEGKVCQQDSPPFDGPFPSTTHSQTPKAETATKLKARTLRDEEARKDRARFVSSIMPEALRRALR